MSTTPQSAKQYLGTPETRPTTGAQANHDPAHEFAAAYETVTRLLEGMQHPRLIGGVAAMILTYSFPDQQWLYRPGDRLGISELLRRTGSRVEGFNADEDLQGAFREQLLELKNLGALKMSEGCWIIPDDHSNIRSPQLREAVRVVINLLSRQQAEHLAAAALVRRPAVDVPEPEVPERAQITLLGASDLPFPSAVLNSYDHRALRRLSPVRERILYFDANRALADLTPETLSQYPLPDNTRVNSASVLASPIRRYLLDSIISQLAAQRPDLRIEVFEGSSGSEREISKFKVKVQGDGKAFVLASRNTQEQITVCQRLVSAAGSDGACSYDFTFGAPGDTTHQLRERSSVPASVVGALLKISPDRPQLVTCMLIDDFNYMMEERSATAGLGRTFARDLRDNQNLVIVVNATGSSILQTAARILSRDPQFCEHHPMAAPATSLVSHLRDDLDKIAARDRRGAESSLAKIYEHLDRSIANFEGLARGREMEIASEKAARRPSDAVMSIGVMLQERSRFIQRFRRGVVQFINDLQDEPQTQVFALLEHVLGMRDPFPAPKDLAELRSSPLGALASPRLRLSRLGSELFQMGQDRSSGLTISTVAEAWNNVVKTELRKTAGPQGSPLAPLLLVDSRRLGLKP